jgi:peptide-methionine (S)-S-oxide reductase
VFEQMPGVTSVVSGYMGGELPNPSYEAVCTGQSGYAEVVQINFNPELTSFTELLKVFFTIHDPTSLNRQGNDAGTQYRSAIFYHSAVQHKEAQTIIDELNQRKAWSKLLVTEVVEAAKFYPAEAYHQHYFANHPEQGYCQFVISPKVQKFRKVFLHS